MNKMRLLAASAGLLFLSACIPYTPYVVQSEGTPLSEFSKITVKVDATAFLKTQEGTKHYKGYVKACKQMDEMVTSRVQGYIDKNFHGKAGAPAAVLTITVDDFATGSGAGRLFLAMSSGPETGNGHLNVSVTITGGDHFTAHTDITGIGVSEINAYNDIAFFTNAYLKNHFPKD